MNSPKKNPTQKKADERRGLSPRMSAGTVPGVRPYDVKRALEYSFWLLSRRARTEKEIREKLLGKECEDKVVEAVIRKLYDLKFLNDFEFAKNYIRQSKIIKPKGKYRLTQELVRKGVEKEVVESALEEEFVDEEDELAEQALKLYFKKIQNLPREKQYNRAMGYLLRRGFSLNAAKKAFNAIFDSSRRF